MGRLALTFTLFLASAALGQGTSCCIEGTGSEWASQPGAHDDGPCLLDRRCARHSNLTDKPPRRCGILGPDGVWHGWLVYDKDGVPTCDWPGNSPHPAHVEERTPEQMSGEAVAAVGELVKRNSPAGTLDQPAAQKELNETIDALRKRCESKQGAAQDDESIGRVSTPCETAIRNLEAAFTEYTRGSGDTPRVGSPPPGTGTSSTPPAAAPVPTAAARPAGEAAGNEGDVLDAQAQPGDRDEQQCETPHFFTIRLPGRKLGDDYHHTCVKRTLLIDRDDVGREYRAPQPWRHSQDWDDEITELPPVKVRGRCGGAYESIGPNLREESPMKTKPERTRCGCLK